MRKIYITSIGTLENTRARLQKLFITMDELKHFTGEGYFDLSREEQERYSEMIFRVCENVLGDLERKYPNDNMKLLYMLNLHELKQYFIQEEDYEMTYLINETIKRMNDERNENR
jgi:hypothetical protein